MPLARKRRAKKKEKKIEVGRETESKRHLKQMKRVSFTIHMNYEESAHNCV